MTADAEWKLIGLSEKKYVSYIDSSRIRTEGQYKSVWYLWDYISPQTEASGKPYISTGAKLLLIARLQKPTLLLFTFTLKRWEKGM